MFRNCERRRAATTAGRALTGAGTRQKASKAKIAVFTCPLDVQMTETKGTVLIKNADEMLNFSKGEESQMEQQFREIEGA